ncbi:hypothetical protein ACJJTC_012544 [Scirpophaga incertulas]
MCSGKQEPEIKKNRTYEIWEVLEKFGKYQILQYIFICVPTLFITMGNINYVFVVGDVDYRCKVPECDGTNTSMQVDWWPNKTIDRCLKPVLKTTIGDQEECTADSFGDDLEECKEWIYEGLTTVVSELDLACKPWYINSVGTVHNLGMLISMIITGWMSDKFGRKYTLLFCMVSCAVGVFKVFAKTYPTYIFIEFLEAFLGGGSYSSATVLMIEITGRKQRILSGVLFAYAIYMGEAMFAVIAMLIPYWKTLVAVTYVPILFSIFMLCFMKESPRWLVLNGKTDEAIKNLKDIAESNNMNINTEHLSQIDAKKLREMFNIQNYTKQESFVDVLRSREMLKRITVASFCRFTSNFVYYGIMINSVFLPGDKYTNFLLSTVMSFPGELISLYLMNKIGRKMPLVVGFIFCGGLCVVSAFVPDNVAWAKVLLFLFAKVVMSACFTGAVTYCLELFPTSARGLLLGMCAFSARLGGMLAPLTPILNEVSNILPALCFGASAAITGALITLTPETKHMPLLDTVEQVEASVRSPEKNPNLNNGKSETKL